MKKTYINKLLITAILMVGLSLFPYSAFAQGGFVRLQPVETHDTISSNGDSAILLAAGAGGFGSVKIQTLDSYTGVWEVRCSLNATTLTNGSYDSDNPLKLQSVNSDTTVYSVNSEIGIWDVQNAAGCKAIKVLATSGFAASDTVVYISATESGGGSGGGSSTVSLTGDISGNGAAGNTGAAVPAQADYLGINVGGNLTGVSTANPIPVSDAGGSLTIDGTVTANAGSGTFVVGDGSGALTVDGTVTANLGTLGGAATAAKQPALGTAGTASTDVISVQGIASGTNLNVNCQVGCTGGTTDTDDGTIAGAQVTAIQNALNYWWDGSNWKRITFGTAGTAAAQVLTVQGVASMTPILTTLSGTNVVRNADGAGNLLTSLAAGSERALTVSVVDPSGNQISSFGGAGGTSSAFGSTFPSGAGSGTAVGGYDGTNMQAFRVVDSDTGGGAFWTMAVNNVFRTSGTPVEAGTSSNPWNVVFPSAQAVTATLAAETTKVIGTVNVAASQTIAVTSATASNLNAQVVGAAASGASKAGNPVQTGAVYNSTQPTVTTGQAVENQATARGAQIVGTGADTFNVTVNAAIAAGNNNIGDVDIASALPAGTNAIGKLTANDGVDIGDVTVNNASGASAVNVQDGGNSLTVDYATTGSGTATGALRVELPTNGTGTLATVTTVTTVGAVTAITNALPAGTNAIGKLSPNSGVDIGDVTLTANSGIDIGDVDVTSVIAGTGATNLGKAEDAGHTSADTGVMFLGVRTATAPTDKSAGATNGDYEPLQVDANGRVYTNDSLYTPNGDSAMNDTADAVKTLLVDSTGAAATLASDYAQASTTSGQYGPLVQGAVTTSAPTYTSGQTNAFSLDTTGSLRVSVTSGSTGNGAASNTGAAVPTQAGYTGVNVAGNLRGMTGVNPSGSIYAGQVDVAAIAGATAATNSGNKDAGTQRMVIATDQLALVGLGIYTEDAAETPAGNLAMSGTVRRDTAASSAGTAGDNATLNTDALGKLWISGAYAEDSAHTSADLGLLGFAVRRDANTSLVDTTGDYAPLQVDSTGNLKVAIISGAGSGGTSMTDDAAFTPATTSISPIGAEFDDSSPDSVDEGDGGVVRMSSNRNLYTTLRDAAGSERGVNVNASNRLLVNIDTDATINIEQLNGTGIALNSGNKDGGTQRIVIATDQLALVGFGAYTEDQGETAGGNLIMSGSVRRDVAASSAGTTADNATFNTDALGLLWTRHLDPCDGVAKVYVPFSISSATTTQIVAASSSNYNYICSINIVAGAAENVALIEDDTAACASPTAGMAGGLTAATGWNFAANGGLTHGNGAATIFKTAATNRYSCLITSSTAQLSGTISYVQAP